MSAVRQDYLINQIDLLRQFVARVLKTGNHASFEEALQLALHLQEKLVPLPPQEFLKLDVTAQLAVLKRGESPIHGEEKCLLYAELLQNMGALYDYRGRTDLATGARQLALHVALQLALATSPSSSTATAFIKQIQPLLTHGDLHPPVRELLEEFVARAN